MKHREPEANSEDNLNGRNFEDGKENNFEEVKRRGFKKVENRGRPVGYPRMERKRNGFCSYWNRGTCSFGDFCRNLHEEIPYCRFDRSCRNEHCEYFHSETKSTFYQSPSSSSSFLARGNRAHFRFRQEEFPQMGSRSRGFNQQQNQNQKQRR